MSTSEDCGGLQALSLDEAEQVSGGVLPLIGAGVALASHVGVGGVATSVTGHLLSGFGLGYAVFSAASYYGGSSNRRPVGETTAK